MSGDDIRLFVGTGVLVLAHRVAPRLMQLRERVAPTARSCAGGLAVAYVFMHLLPELDLGHDLLGSRIYVLVLAGFLLVFSLEHHLVQRTEQASPRAC